MLALHNQPQEQFPALSRSAIAMPRTAQPNQEAQEPTPYTPPGRPKAPVSVHSHTDPTAYKTVTRWPGPEMRHIMGHREQFHSQSSNQSLVRGVSGDVHYNPVSMNMGHFQVLCTCGHYMRPSIISLAITIASVKSRLITKETEGRITLSSEAT